LSARHVGPYTFVSHQEGPLPLVGASRMVTEKRRTETSEADHRSLRQVVIAPPAAPTAGK